MAIVPADVALHNSSVGNAYGDANNRPRVPWSNAGQVTVAGELAVAMLRWPSNLTSATSDHGWSLAGQIQTQTIYLAIWYKILGDAEADASWSMSSGSGWDIICRRYTGADTTTPLDRFISNPGNSTEVTSRSTGTTAATQAADELLWAAWVVHDNVSNWSANNSFSIIEESPRALAADRILSAAAGSTYTSTASWTTSRRAHGMMATFYPLSATHATPTPAVIATTSTVPDVTTSVTSTATVVAVVIDTTTNIPSPVLSSVIPAAVIATTSTVPTPTFLIIDTVAGVTVATTTSLPAPTIHFTNSPIPSTIATLTTLPSPVVAAGQVVAATVIATTVAIPVPTIEFETGFSGSPNTIATTSSFSSVTVDSISNANTPADGIYTYVIIGSASAPADDTTAEDVLLVALMEKLNLLAGTVGLELDGAANAWAGTFQLPFIAALNVKAGTVGLEFNAVAKMLALQNGGNPFMDGFGAILSIPVDDILPTPTSATQAVTTILLVASLPVASVQTVDPETPPVAANGLRQIVYVGSHNTNAVTEGQASVLANLDYIDEVCPSWYCPTFAADGTISIQNQASAEEDLNFIEACHDAGIATRPVLANYYPGLTASSNDWDWAPISTILNDSGLRSTLITNIVSLVTTKGYSGIDIDFEHPNRVGSTNTNTAEFKSTDRDVMTTFIQDLATALHAENRTLAVTWPAKQSASNQDAWDHYALGQAADQCRIMIYDDYGYGTTPFPPAANSWWESAASFTAGHIPADKLVLGAANYGFIWSKPTGDAWTSGTTASPTDFVWAEKATVIDPYSPTITLEDGMRKAEWTTGGNDYLAYFEDADTLATKAAIAKKFGAAGVHYWRAGHEDPDLYSTVETVLAGTGSYSMDIQPMVDTTLDAGDTDNDRSNLGTVLVKGSLPRRALMRFIIPDLPDNATITSTTLNLYKNGFFSTDPVGRTYEVDRLTQTGWPRDGDGGNPTSHGTTWLLYDVAGGLSWTTAGGDYTTTDGAQAVVPATNNWMTWDVADLVAWAQTNGGELHILIRDTLTTGNHQAQFVSSEGAVTNRPTLTITYTVA